MNKTVNSVGN